MALSRAQLAKRLLGITATDAAAISGVHPYRGAVDVWLDKRGEAPPWVDNTRTKWGELLEPVVRNDFGERHGCRVVLPGTVSHPTIDWAMATPDGVAWYPGEPRPRHGLEIKCHTWQLAHHYGAPLTDEVPLHELVQCAWNMFVTGLDRWYLCAFIDGQPTDYLIDRDDELIDMLSATCESFLVVNVRGGEPPAPDGSSAYHAWLSRRHPRHSDDDFVAVAEDDPDVVRLRDASAAEADAQLACEAAKQAVKARIGDKHGLQWVEAATRKRRRITWSLAADSHPVDYEGALRDAGTIAALGVHALLEGGERWGEALEALRKIADVETLIKARTGTTPGSRRLHRPRSWKARKDKE